MTLFDGEKARLPSSGSLERVYRARKTEQRADLFCCCHIFSPCREGCALYHAVSGSALTEDGSWT